MVSCFREYRKTLCLALVLQCLLGGVTLAQSVKSSYRPGIDFSKYHTYTWVESKHQHPDPTVDAQIKQSFDTQLADKGLKKTDGTADLNIDYQTAITQQGPQGQGRDGGPIASRNTNRSQSTWERSF